MGPRDNLAEQKVRLVRQPTEDLRGLCLERLGSSRLVVASDIGGLLNEERRLHGRRRMKARRLNWRSIHARACPPEWPRKPRRASARRASARPTLRSLRPIGRSRREMRDRRSANGKCRAGPRSRASARASRHHRSARPRTRECGCPRRPRRGGGPPSPLSETGTRPACRSSSRLSRTQITAIRLESCAAIRCSSSGAYFRKGERPGHRPGRPHRRLDPQ